MSRVETLQVICIFLVLTSLVQPYMLILVDCPHNNHLEYQPVHVTISPPPLCSNGAVCGALMGCKFGFKALPQDLLAFTHRDWLDTQVDKFLATIGLN